MEALPPYQTQPQNGFSPISNAPTDVLINIFEQLPEPSFVRGTRAPNRSAVLGVSRRWKDVGSAVLRKSIYGGGRSAIDKHNAGGVVSWEGYEERERHQAGVDNHPPLVTNLYLDNISSSVSDRFLFNLSGLTSLTVGGAELGEEGFVLPEHRTEDSSRYIAALSGMFCFWVLNAL